MFIDFREDKPIFDAIRIVGGKFNQRDVFAIQGAIAEARRIGDDKPIFDVARQLDDDQDGLSQLEVETINAGLAAARAGAAAIPPVGTSRQIGSRGLAILHEFEPGPGGKVALVPYYCPAHVLTIGWGHTGPDVKPGMVITEAQADSLLQADLDRFEDTVSNAAANTTQNQFDAMVCLTYNIGIGAFLKSSVLRLHNAGDYRRAAEAFGMWIKGDGRVLPGLQRRRAREADLYRSVT